jgi:predicted nucleotidyltransferase component of viral defense system
MISQESLHTDWIKHVAGNHRNADKILVEKVIRALLLLEGLVQSELPFTFKGGTAVMLLQSPIKRFSIDIDIVVAEISDLESSFEKISLTWKSTITSFITHHPIKAILTKTLFCSTLS